MYSWSPASQRSFPLAGSHLGYVSLFCVVVLVACLSGSSVGASEVQSYVCYIAVPQHQLSAVPQKFVTLAQVSILFRSTVFSSKWRNGLPVSSSIIIEFGSSNAYPSRTAPRVNTRCNRLSMCIVNRGLFVSRALASSWLAQLSIEPRCLTVSP